MEHKALADATAELRAWAEIDEEPETDASCLQVIHELCFVYRHQGTHRLDLDEKHVGNQEIRAKFANYLPAVAHHYRLLAFDCQPALLQLDRKSVLVNRLKESVPQSVVSIVERAGHALAQLPMNHSGRSHASALLY